MSDIAPNHSADTRKRIDAHVAALGCADQDTAANAEYRLIRFGSKALGALLRAAEAPDPQVRFRAVWALGKIKDERALATILRLTDDGDHRVAYDAILALGELGDARALPKLWEFANRPADERALDSAARTALMKLGALP